MQRIILTRGLPASGKSTWAKEFIKKNPGWKRVNKDDLRSMLDAGVWSKKNEKFVLRVRDEIVEHALIAGYSVIVDDTNLDPSHEARMVEIAERLTGVLAAVQVEVDDSFCDVPVETCILRDAARGDKAVGPKVIREMYHKYLGYNRQVIPRKVPLDSSKPDAVIFDLDGTLALLNGRDPYRGQDCGTDSLNAPVAAVFHALRAQGYKMVILSGRMDQEGAGEKTRSWLAAHGIVYDHFEMRADGDTRKDSLLKAEMLARVQEKYNVIMTFDDRDQVVEMWRAQGIPCLQVAPGDF